ncbi:helicase-associated domain-containing protein [Longimicrobium sp.]|uniref:helicase-associated domain-containing protein n=1 Tax=Longimicrobium sp. TaxID=2029185 RepID=UPI002E34CBF4|nr:helicase-associated domain-containing protein [Longimicrobium sp.]HEX6039203.1 helicase-associated domain-containing protein [Longimicrobium sp.]
MRVPPENWTGALEWLPRWEGVSAAARAGWLTLKPTPGAGPLPARIGDELVGAGLLEPPGPKGRQYKVPADAKPLLRVLRAMDRVPVFDLKDGAAQTYVREHFTHEQVNLLNGHGQSFGWGSHAGELEERVSSAGWIQALLDLRDADAARGWETPRRPSNELLLLADPWVLSALQRLVTALTKHPGGIPLRQVDEVLADVDARHRAQALAAGARYLFLFPALRKAGIEAWVGLLPSVALRMGPPPPPPAPVRAVETFEAPFRLGDMTAVAVEAATEPIPVRASDQALYARSTRGIGERLAHLPPWAESVLVRPGDDEMLEEDEDAPLVADRIGTAVGLLSSLRLIQLRSTARRQEFVLTDAGQRWLAGSEGERLKHLLDAMRGSPQRVPGAWYSDSGKITFFGLALPFSLPEKGLDLREPLSRAFLSVPDGALVSLAAFTSHESRTRNPMLAAGATLRRDHSMPRTSEGWENTWASILGTFLLVRLVSFGGARLGRLEDGSLAFGLTETGRYLLGERDDFALPAEPGGGEVVIQPDFEIVFLAPAPRAEAEVGRIAERTGAGVGSLFRLTRASVLRVAEQGMTAEQVLGTLESVARGGVPDNVARQVRDWMKAVRTLRITPAVLIDCPDAETAARVRSMGGAHVSQLTPTLLRLDGNSAARTALVKRLRDKGIFVAADGGAAPAARGRPGRGRT